MKNIPKIAPVDWHELVYGPPIHILVDWHLVCVCIWGGGWGLGVGSIKKQEKNSFLWLRFVHKWIIPNHNLNQKNKNKHTQISKKLIVNAYEKRRNQQRNE